MSPVSVRKPGRLPSKPLSLDPYLEILREKVTGDKTASVRKYCRAKIRKLTHQEVPRNVPANKKTTSPKVPPPPVPPTPCRKRPVAG